jgi:4-hydroxybenzoyl-CoA thioesterase
VTGYVFRRMLTVEWGDCDPARIVFYPNYFKWFDGLTLAMFAERGLPLAQLQNERGMLGLPLVDARASFRSPASFGDRLEAETSIAEWRRTSFRVRHLLGQRGRPVAEGEEVRIWAMPDPADPKRIRPAEIPEEVKARFEG